MRKQRNPTGWVMEADEQRDLLGEQVEAGGRDATDLRSAVRRIRAAVDQRLRIAAADDVAQFRDLRRARGALLRECQRTVAVAEAEAESLNGQLCRPRHPRCQIERCASPPRAVLQDPRRGEGREARDE